jgi:hypothetical protein
VVVSSAPLLLLLLMLFGFVSRESATHKRESITRGARKRVCACVLFVYTFCVPCALEIFVVGVSQFVVGFRGVFYVDFGGDMVLGGSWRKVCQLAPCWRHPKIITSLKMVWLSTVSFFEINRIL